MSDGEGADAPERLRYRVRHVTTYRYPTEVRTGYSEARLLPRRTPDQEPERAELVVEPIPADRRDRLDHFGNPTTYLAVRGPHRQLVVTTTAEVAVRRSAWRWAHPAAEVPWDDVAERLRRAGTGEAEPDPEVVPARELVLPSPLVPAAPTLATLGAAALPPGRPLREGVVDLCHRVHEAVAYVPGATTISTRPDQALAAGAGVCQDQAHVLVGALRSRGLAARYVSGYLETDPPPGRPRLVGADATHAWASVLVPDLGWLDLDPTNDAVPDGRHLTLAWGRDFADVTPLKGVIYAGAGTHELDVAVDVERC